MTIWSARADVGARAGAQRRGGRGATEGVSRRAPRAGWAGACLDTGHLIHSAQLGKHLDPAQQIRVMGARNFGMHLKDYDNKKKTDVPFGQGELDVASVLKALKDVDFKGYIAIEYEANPKDPMADMTACVKYLREVAKKA